MSEKSTAITSVLSIVTDLGLHIWNYGVPIPKDATFWSTEDGLALVGTSTGILATSIQSGVSSGVLTKMVEGLPSEYDKKLARVVIASSTLNTKMLSQFGVTLAYGMMLSSPNFLSSYSAKQLLPSLVIHGIIAGTLPYMMKD